MIYVDARDRAQTQKKLGDLVGTTLARDRTSVRNCWYTTCFALGRMSRPQLTNNEKRHARILKLTLELDALPSDTVPARLRAQRIRTELVELLAAHARHVPLPRLDQFTRCLDGG
jgi:hypothetical protein